MLGLTQLGSGLVACFAVAGCAASGRWEAPAGDAAVNDPHCLLEDRAIRCTNEVGGGDDIADNESTQRLDLTLASEPIGAVAVNASVDLVALYYPEREVGLAHLGRMEGYEPWVGDDGGVAAGFVSRTRAVPYAHPAGFERGTITGTLSGRPDGCVDVAITLTGGYRWPSITWEGPACAQ